MIRTLFFSIFFLIVIASQAQLEKYNVSSIPDSLRKHADAVIREDDIIYIVKDASSATMTAHFVVTILNEKDKRDLAFSERSDKFQYLDEATINIYDAQGNKIKTYNKRDMQTSAYGEGLVEDGQTTYFVVTPQSYPITVKKNYVIKHKGLLNYVNYYIANFDCSVQEGSYKISVPTELGLRYKAVNTILEPFISNEGANTVYKWSVNNVKPQSYESFSGPSIKYTPYIAIAPNKFQMDDYQGDMATWKDFGNWSYSMKKVVCWYRHPPPNRKRMFLPAVPILI